jgi:hypothetical protein
MSRVLLIVSTLIVLTASLVFASQAAAGTTTVAVTMTFAEPIVPGLVRGCAIPPNQGLCGSGEVIPFGHATDTVVFGGACGGNCDLRTINLASGSIFSDEVFSNFVCPGRSCGRPGRGGPAFGTLTDVIVGGTGIFTGASGNLSGSVTGAGTAGVARLMGTITLTP